MFSPSTLTPFCSGGQLFFSSILLLWRSITAGEFLKPHKDMTKQKKDGDAGLAQEAFFFYFKPSCPPLVAYIPINYPILISEIKNTPRNDHRAWETWDAFEKPFSEIVSAEKTRKS